MFYFLQDTNKKQKDQQLNVTSYMPLTFLIFVICSTLLTHSGHAIMTRNPTRIISSSPHSITLYRFT